MSYPPMPAEHIINCYLCGYAVRPDHHHVRFTDGDQAHYACYSATKPAESEDKTTEGFAIVGMLFLRVVCRILFGMFIAWILLLFLPMLPFWIVAGIVATVSFFTGYRNG